MNIKEVQRLVEQIAVLSKFISHSIDMCAKVFRILKNHKTFDQSSKCAKAFEDLKSYLTSTPILSKPKDGEELYLYLVVSAHIVSSVLVRVVEGTQKPVYMLIRLWKMHRLDILS